MGGGALVVRVRLLWSGLVLLRRRRNRRVKGRTWKLEFGERSDIGPSRQHRDLLFDIGRDVLSALRIF